MSEKSALEMVIDSVSVLADHVKTSNKNFRWLKEEVIQIKKRLTVIEEQGKEK